ncbi:hypothetical protein CAPTEDRAFT_213742 [Capitella teleta]|uniref:Uncharacterized protein n=1 Tax=Capitella teleta TaxID=283909 RepID=R7THY8_CAPTE|nr:hypothetical protein CAPTEDRAFT_213742 [Capitella teleta]|eukprot:ELT93438.1 hypothetical protein CAPTEDRAFT_213742 [Capitella teleta]
MDRTECYGCKPSNSGFVTLAAFLTDLTKSREPFRKKERDYKSFDQLNEYFVNTALSKKKLIEKMNAVEPNAYHQGLLSLHDDPDGHDYCDGSDDTDGHTYREDHDDVADRDDPNGYDDHDDHDNPDDQDVPDDHGDHDNPDDQDVPDDHDDPDDPDGHTDRNDHDDSRDDCLDKEPGCTEILLIQLMSFECILCVLLKGSNTPYSPYSRPIHQHISIPQCTNTTILEYIHITRISIACNMKVSSKASTKKILRTPGLRDILYQEIDISRGCTLANLHTQSFMWLRIASHCKGCIHRSEDKGHLEFWDLWESVWYT